MTTSQPSVLHSPPAAIYVHIPFCARRCPYCDFTAFAGRDAEIPAYVAALRREIQQTPWFGTTVHSVYFGGGTPSYLGARHLASIMDTIQRTFSVAPNAEVTFEANPAATEAEGFSVLRQSGFTRVSVGVQSLDDQVLRFLGRLHTAGEALNVLATALSQGFRSVSADLIFAVPGQTPESWVRSVETVASCGVHHISTYGLTIEEGTPFGRRLQSGKLRPVHEELAAEMYITARRVLVEAGFEPYEISNFALPGHRCLHNMAYWTHKPYLGFGAGAVSCVHGIRTTNVSDTRGYIDCVRSGASTVTYRERLTDTQLVTEALMLGLRLADGVDLAELERQYRRRIREQLGPRIRRQVEGGFLTLAGERLSLTPHGVLLADSVIADLAAGLE